MGLPIKNLRKGDRVVISKSSLYYNTSSFNPPDSIKGTVICDGSGSVEWDNGKTNGYGDNDLVKVSETAPVSSELTKEPTIGKWYTNPKWCKGSMAKARYTSEDNFCYSECIYLGDSKTVKSDSQWPIHNGVRLATTDELRNLPKDHPDNPDYTGSELKKDYKRGTPIGTYTPKEGDTVKIIANKSNSANRIGEFGIVGSITGIHCIVKVPGTLRGVITHYFDDLELVSSKSSTTFKFGDIVKVDPSELSKPLPPVDRGAYSTKSVYKNGEKVTVRLIKDLSFENSRIKDIPIGTCMICDGGYFSIPGSTSSLHPNDNKYEYNFPRGWFEVLGIHERDIPKSKTPILDPITSSPKVWRVKTRAEMVADGTISSSERRPKDWAGDGAMDKYFGTIIDSRHYESIESCEDSNSHKWIGSWWVCKRELTTKPLLFGIVSVEDDERDNISWESDVSYDYDLDKLDEMSKEDDKWFEETSEPWPDIGSPSTYSKRPKTEVVIIPQRKRMVY